MIDSQDSLDMRVRTKKKCIADKGVIIPFLFFLLIILVSCIPATTEEPTWQPPTPTPTFRETVLTPPFTSTGSPAASITGQFTQLITPGATRCPRATQEPFWVDPVTSPTDQLSQVIAVHIGNGEWVTIITESGTFSVTDNNRFMEISLLSNTVHHLEVIARVRRVPASNGCIYGGYTLRTTRDRQGSPLNIAQRESVP